MITNFKDYIKESRLINYIIESEKTQMIRESSEFNQYQLGLPGGVDTFGPGYGFATDPGLSIYSPDSNPYVDLYARTAGTTSRLMQIIQQFSKEMSDDHIYTRKTDRFLDDISEYKNIKILRIFPNENLKLNVYISFDFMDDEFFGVFRNFNSNLQKTTFDTELLSDSRYGYIDKEYYFKLNQFLYKTLYDFFIPKAGLYKNLKKNCPLRDGLGQIKYLEEGKSVDVKGYNLDENNDPYIIINISDHEYYITGNDYFYFKYWFEEI